MNLEPTKQREQQTTERDLCGLLSLETERKGGTEEQRETGVLHGYAPGLLINSLHIAFWKEEHFLSSLSLSPEQVSLATDGSVALLSQQVTPTPPSKSGY
ncbi:Hypothetical predicted protein [Scomber scombrus]|uniref:Uncharacterized protein n=1 Tax=Scomber scombrus TaxID=13677 RepID=A0AAV1P5P9_SCOSC